MSPDMTEVDRLEAFNDPQPGDRYTDMFSWWMFILYAGPNGGTVITTSSPAPCTFPDDGKIEIFDTADQFRNKFSYPSKPGKPWPRIVDRDNDVSGWLQR